MILWNRKAAPLWASWFTNRFCTLQDILIWWEPHLPCQLPHNSPDSHFLAAGHKRWWCLSLVRPWSAPGPWSWSPAEGSPGRHLPNWRGPPPALPRPRHHHLPRVQACPVPQTHRTHPRSGKAGGPGRSPLWSPGPGPPPGRQEVKESVESERQNRSEEDEQLIFIISRAGSEAACSAFLSECKSTLQRCERTWSITAVAIWLDFLRWWLHQKMSSTDTARSHKQQYHTFCFFF